MLNSRSEPSGSSRAPPSRKVEGSGWTFTALSRALAERNVWLLAFPEGCLESKETHGEHMFPLFFWKAENHHPLGEPNLKSGTSIGTNHIPQPTGNQLPGSGLLQTRSRRNFVARQMKSQANVLQLGIWISNLNRDPYIIHLNVAL